MEHLPIYIAAVFIATTLLSLLMFYKASHYSRPLLMLWVFWLIIQAIVALSGFYKVTNVMPPRFGLLLLPPVIFLVARFFTKGGRQFIDGLDVKTLTLLHTVRIPVELTLYWLFIHKTIPEVMTFEGRNFDIICGLTAPFTYYFGYVENKLSKNLLIGWNIVCLLLLLNIVVTALLSAPFPFQKLGFDQPNIALLYFPFIWLPCFVVPLVMFSHLVTLRRLIKNN